MTNQDRIEESDMVFPFTALRRACAATLGAGAVFFGAAGPAAADPPNCTSADLAGVMAGVMAATSAYLFTHPPVNDFFTGIKRLNTEEKRAALTVFLDEHPQVKAELRGIRQPAVDFRNRCG
ncbi:heme-binding protein [Mycolicibacterium sp.]|uniref:heme-binding protein n=1 Tax=Mycolicibacterium sp. TaxID=2320850 RepID=UPI003D095C30